MNCWITAIACDSVLIVPIWTDSIPPFRTSACDGLNSLPCPWPQLLTANSACSMDRKGRIALCQCGLKNLSIGADISGHLLRGSEADSRRAKAGRGAIRPVTEAGLGGQNSINNLDCNRTLQRPAWAGQIGKRLAMHPPKCAEFMQPSCSPGGPASPLFARLLRVGN
jgi:hypothetical protein